MPPHCVSRPVTSMKRQPNSPSGYTQQPPCHLVRCAPLQLFVSTATMNAPSRIYHGRAIESVYSSGCTSGFVTKRLANAASLPNDSPILPSHGRDAPYDWLSRFLPLGSSLAGEQARVLPNVYNAPRHGHHSYGSSNMLHFRNRAPLPP